MEYTLGLDFGTSSVRACILEIHSGQMISKAVCSFKGGKGGIFIKENNPLLARQSPLEYMRSLEVAVKEAIKDFEEVGFSVNDIIGIGVDTTGSTPIPVKQNMQPLADLPEFRDNLNAYAWLWKDHTSVKEAIKITEKAKQIRPEYLNKCGGTYSSEWFWSKVWHCLNCDPEVYKAADSWVEQSDFIPATLAGIDNVKHLKRNICAAGHKAMFSDTWGGFPDEEFLASLDPALVRLKDNLHNKAYTFQEIMGFLSSKWARRLGIPEGIPIAVGALDAHVGAIGAGVGNGKLVKIIGTSTCDIMAFPEDQAPADFNGVAGIVKGSVLPGNICIEAGQAAVGDLLNWWVQNILIKEESHHKLLTEKASALKVGESGLLALDWNNGNRNILGDQQLTGLLIGQTLATKDYEIYRALIEATSFGALKIIKLIESKGIVINEVIITGGIGHKNQLFMQIYADVIGYPVSLVENPQTVAVGAAIMAAFAVKNGLEGFSTIEEVVDRLSVNSSKVFIPNKENHETYSYLFRLFSQLHDAFGINEVNDNLYNIMKELISIRDKSNT